MGESQNYSRVPGINLQEKRRILGEIDRIQRDLEPQRVKLQQLKRKSLRDRWLMEGLVPSSAVEAENPLAETEGEIKKLEQQLANLQSELVYLENPELRVLKATKVQVSALQNDLVNGDVNQKEVDQNENHKDHMIREEDDQLEEEDPTISSSTLSKDESAGHIINLVQENNLPDHDHPEKTLDLEPTKQDDQTQPNQGVNDHKEVDGPENDLVNSEHSQELTDQKVEPEKQSSQDRDSNDDLVDKEVQIIPVEKMNSLQTSLETKEHDMENLAKELARDIVNFEAGNSDLSDSWVKQDEDHQGESLLDEINKLVNRDHQEESKEGELSSVTEELGQVSVQNEEESDVPVSVSLEQGNGLDGDIASALDQERSEIHLLNAEGPADKPTSISLKFDMTESSELKSEFRQEDHEEPKPLPCTDQAPSLSLPCKIQNQTDQVQISHVLVVAPPGLDLNSQQGSSASGQPGKIETNTPPESQPLLQKAPETDGHREANTAETRDKSTPEKKKTCHCCVVM